MGPRWLKLGSPPPLLYLAALSRMNCKPLPHPPPSPQHHPTTQVDSWLSQQLVRFASTDFGDSVVAADDLLKNLEETYEPALRKNKSVCASLGVRGACACWGFSQPWVPPPAPLP
jgi:hypothetical protein